MLLFAVQFGGLYTGMALGTPAGTTALIACSSPLLVAAVGALLGWDRLTPRAGLGIGLGVVGVAVTLADRLGRPPTVAALAWTLLGLAGLAAGTVLQGRLRSTAGPAALAGDRDRRRRRGDGGLGTAAGSLAVPATHAKRSSHCSGSRSSRAWSARCCSSDLIRERGAARASSLLFVVPAVTALAAWPILGTPVGPATAVRPGDRRRRPVAGPQSALRAQQLHRADHAEHGREERTEAGDVAGARPQRRRPRR